VFSDKIIDKELADGVKEWISMTKVAKLFEEEKELAVKQATEQVTKQVTKQVTNELTEKYKAGTEKLLKEKGWSDEEIKEFIQVAIS
jgi:SOS response regulatory protein OraA/RecX